jgi:hypothetical protein
MRKLLKLVPLLIGIAYLAWPATAAWQLRTALKARDTAAIESRVDLGTLRANLKRTIALNLADEEKNRDSGFITKALKRSLGPVVADKVIDIAVTPRTLGTVLSGRSLLDGFGLTGTRSGETPESALERDAEADPLAPRRLRWAFLESPTRFRIETADPKLPDRRVVSILALQGTTWRLVDVYYRTLA